MTRRLLELFSGTKSISKAVGDKFDEIISVDILTKFNATITTDILTWDFTIYPPNHFDAIWASPPCTEFSTLKITSGAVRNLELANSIVQRTLVIINYFKPKKWFIENPQTGLLKSQSYMNNIPFYDVDYCRYAEWGYRKRTRIWTNVIYDAPLLCLGRNACTQMIPDTRAHKLSNGNSVVVGRKSVKKEHLYRIPEKLVKELFDCPANAIIV